MSSFESVKRFSTDLARFSICIFYSVEGGLVDRFKGRHHKMLVCDQTRDQIVFQRVVPLEPPRSDLHARKCAKLCTGAAQFRHSHRTRTQQSSCLDQLGNSVFKIRSVRNIIAKLNCFICCSFLTFFCVQTMRTKLTKHFRGLKEAIQDTSIVGSDKQ